MKQSTASHSYCQRHIEQDLPAPPCNEERWQHVIVIPAYRESSSILNVLRGLSRDNIAFLAIIVLNRPDSDGNLAANKLLCDAALALPAADEGEGCYRLGGASTLLLHDSEALRGPLPADQGVGLARKIGCDIAWQWINRGCIDSHWIHCTDADAKLPRDYFQRIDCVDPGTAAATYPFIHTPGSHPACDRATALYELRLHHYVLGLEYSGSPYAFHSLGSSIAISADAYAKVRGFPRRAAGEDFYLLNKLAKVGAVERLRGDCIELESRESHRVPFGTGPAVARLSPDEASPALFYHPHSFAALRALLQIVERHTIDAGTDLQSRLGTQGLDSALASACEQVLTAMGWRSALAHCARQSAGESQFRRHFHQWFDAFRTLKFIHGLRERGLHQQHLAGLEKLQPTLWPAPAPGQALGEAVRAHWGWTRQDPARW